MVSRPARPVLVATVAAFLVAGSAAVLADRWITELATASARQVVHEGLVPFAEAVNAALSRRVIQITSLRTFVETAEGRAALTRDFEPFSDGLIGSAAGVRAIEVVRHGRIEMVSPLKGNEAALNLEFARHPNPALRSGYRRAMARDAVSIVGPVALAQGGTGLIFFLRARADYDPGIELVEIVYDLPAVLQTMSLSHPPEGLALELRDGVGDILVASHGALGDDAVEVTISGFDGNWHLRGAPSAGWQAAIAPGLRPTRLAFACIVLLLTLVTYQLAGRNARLSRLVEARTASLRQLAMEQQETIERQQRTERALASSEERLRLALAASRAATFEIDVATGDMHWSEGVGALVGRPAGTHPDSFEEALTYIDPAYRDRVASAFATGRDDGGIGTLEVPAPNARGGTTWLALTWASRPDSDGTVRRIVGTLTDISERKRLEEQFLHAQKMQAMGALAGGVAHDFNNLLTVIIGSGHLARQDADAPGVSGLLRAELDEVLNAAQRAAVLTGQLLAFSRRQVVQQRRFDLRELVDGMQVMLRRLVGELLTIETVLPPTPVPVFADPGQLTQVVMNLAINARDAMPDGGALRLELCVASRPSGDPLPGESMVAERFAMLSVHDNGTGIDPAILPRIFEPFFTTKDVGRGTGLGLATVYGIVTQLGGTVRVHSVPGEGTTFEVYVPLDENGAMEAGAGSAQDTAGSGVGYTVLLAEDEPGVRRLVERLLHDAGYGLIVAEDGEAALAAARAYPGPIDLLVTDVVMPRLGGVALATTLRAERPEMRVLMMSGYPQREATDPTGLLGQVPFLSKPFASADLLKAAAAALADA